MKALISGTFDPVTVGHLDVIRRAAAMFDEVYAVVFNNTEKSCLFDLDTRRAMLEAACEGLANVQVISSQAKLIDLVDELGADVIVKGVRNEVDYAYEQKHALYNRAHNPRAETLYLPADPAFDHISSTLVRERIVAGEGLDALVPSAVAAYICKRGE